MEEQKNVVLDTFVPPAEPPPPYDGLSRESPITQQPIAGPVPPAIGSVNTPQVVIVTSYGRKPIIVRCPYCNHAGLTITKTVNRGACCLCYGVVMILCFFLGCCLIPLHCNCGDVKHFCSRCQKHIGTCKGR